MDQKPEVKDLVLQLKDLVDWVPFATQLPGIRQAHIQLIEAQNRGKINDEKRALFIKWLSVYPDASYKDVVNALKKAEETTLAGEIIAKITGKSEGGGEGATPAVDVSKIIDILKSVLDSNYAKVQRAIKTSLEMIAAELFSKRIITDETKGAPTYQKIIDEFRSQLDLADSLEKLQELCQNFLRAIASQGGSAKAAADRLRDEWKKENKEKLKIILKLE